MALRCLRWAILSLAAAFVVANLLVVPDTVGGMVAARQAGAFTILADIRDDPANHLRYLSFAPLYDSPLSMVLARKPPSGAVRDVLVLVRASPEPLPAAQPSFSFVRPWRGRYLAMSASRRPGDAEAVERDLSILFDGLGGGNRRLTPLTELRYVLMTLPREPYERNLRWVMVFQWLARPGIVLYALVLGLTPEQQTPAAAWLLTAAVAAGVLAGLWHLVPRVKRAR